MKNDRRRVLTAGCAALLVGAFIPAAQAQSARDDEMAVIRVTNAIDVAVDRKDWVQARSFFADEVRTDFTSLIGGQPAVVTGDDLIAGWRRNLGPRKSSLHLRGNHLPTVQGDRATVYSHAYAWNRLEGNGEPLWEVWGHYTHELARTPSGWKVIGFTFVMTHERGNMWVKTTPSPVN
ncbi:nuclear transport factor 2 family protein [Reyranella sp. CPCC 100927]|uniref:nuclear transport factor 2 family protein n=1 Tax=Reyranella sp. CPCC 100927 TaxID=2599616 RepID=UPI0011B7D23A|nr:nuclear transport factor 2 family protein [Reyranella sp. CPCC 100927]TWS99886.1 nuclear transport factor 2 family protein [Reyranella sp. CPCC 100927]